MKLFATVKLPAEVRTCFAVSADRTRALVACPLTDGLRLFTVDLAKASATEVPKVNGVVAVDADARRIVATLPGRTVAGVYTWSTVVRDVGAPKGKPLHASTSDDVLRNVGLGADGGWAVRTVGKAETLVRIGPKGTLGEAWPIPAITPVTELRILDDGRVLVGDWHNRVAVFDPTTQTFARLRGNAVRWGRDHDLVARGLAVDGDLVISQSHGGAQLHAWSLARRTALTGAWAKEALTGGGLLGDGQHIVVAHGTQATVHAVGAKASATPVATLELPAGARITCVGDGRHVIVAASTGVAAWDVWTKARTPLARGARAKVVVHHGVAAIVSGATVRFAAGQPA